MCDVKVIDRVPSKELRERLGLDDIISVLQQNRFITYEVSCYSQKSCELSVILSRFTEELFKRIKVFVVI